MVYVPDSDIQDMHSSLIDSHRRSSTASNEPHASSSDEQTHAENQPVKKAVHRQHSAGTTETKTHSIHLGEVPEDDDDDKEVTASVTHSADFFRWTHGHRRVMLTFGTICLFAFMTGVEYAVILPTAFDYVKTMTPVNVYVGLILSSYSISGSIAGVIMGKISDVTGKVKILIIVSNIFEIGGNILYFVTNNIHIVLLGRLIAGVGMGAVPPILADVAHRTTEKDRTKAISIILGCRQLGLLIGPCFTLLVGMMNFHIGSVHVNKLNGPGFLMASIWFTLQIVCWFCFYDRTPPTTTGPSTSTDSPKHKYTRSDHPSRQEQQKLTSKTYCQQYARIEMGVLFLATFIAYFNQTALETIVASFTEQHFGWDTVRTSILFAFAGLEIIIVYIALVFVLTKRFEDRFLLIFGFLSLTLACALGTFFTWSSYSFGWSGRSADGVINQRLFSMFIIFVVLDLLGLPFLAATSVSLFTKLTVKELQGFSQGVQRLIMGIGTIIGPIFASSLLNRLHIMMTTMLTLTVLTLIALVFVLQRLRPLSQKPLPVESKDANNNLNSSLPPVDDLDESAVSLTSKNRYITLVQHDDEPQKNAQSNSLVKRLPSNLDGEQRSSANTSLHFAQVAMNPFGNNAFNGAVQYSGPFPAQNLGQFGNPGGFYSGNIPFQGGNMFGNAAFGGGGAFAPQGFPPGGMGGAAIGGGGAFGSSGFPSGAMGGAVGPNFGLSPFPGNSFGMQPSPYAPAFQPEQQYPFVPSGPPQGQFGDPNRFGSGSYGRPRSRRSSRHRSSSRRRRNSGSSSSDDERRRAGSPYAAAGEPYMNFQPLPSGPLLPPRGGSPAMFPRGGSPLMFPRGGSPAMLQQQPNW